MHAELPLFSHSSPHYLSFIRSNTWKIELSTSHLEAAEGWVAPIQIIVLDFSLLTAAVSTLQAVAYPGLLLPLPIHGIPYLKLEER